MFQTLRTVIMHVPDIAAAKEWYAKATGVAPYFDEPFYVGFDIGGSELGLDPDPAAGTAGTGGTSAYWRVRNVDQVLAHLLSIGGVPVGEVQEVGGGIRVASVRDPFGNTVGVIEIPGEGGGAAGGRRAARMIRPVTRADAGAWQAMRQALWPETTDAEHATDITRYFWSGDDDAACLVADSPDGIIGFVELSIRPYAEGCVTERVGYLEGWYVAPAWRRRGVGRALVAASEAWARRQGCREFASDTPLDNITSQAAHRALGFIEAERITCYCKPLVGLAASRAHTPSP